MMKYNLDSVTAVIINWKTADLIKLSAESLQRFYPDLKLVLIDNGSRDASTAYIKEMACLSKNVSAILNLSNLADRGVKLPAIGLKDTRHGSVLDLEPVEGVPCLSKITAQRTLTGGNVGHGPALHQLLMLARTPLVLALDSDTEILQKGFLEEMLGYFDEELVYAVGRMVWLDRSGNPRPRGAPHIHESVIVLDTQKYKTLMPYAHHGVPSLLNMPDAGIKGYRLVDYRIGFEDTAVHHKFQGSRKRYKRMPKIRKRPIMPRVLLEGLESEFIGDYFLPCRGTK